MANNHLEKRIKALRKLTPSEVKIANYLTSHYQEIAFDNVTTLGEKTDVSKATVVRFINKLGFDSFSDFKDDLRRESKLMQEPLAKRYSMMKKHLTYEKDDVLDQNVENILKNLENTFRNFDRDLIRKTAARIVEPEGNLYVIGQRTSLSFAHLFYVFTNRIRPNTHLIGFNDILLPDILMDITVQDLLFVISRYPYSKQTLKAAQYCHNQGTDVVLVSDSEYSPLSELATIHITVLSDGILNLRSFSPLAALLEVLHIACLQCCDEHVHERLKSAEHLYGEFDVFSPRKSINPGQINEFKKLTKSNSN